MCVENVDATFHAGAAGRASEERLIEQRAGRMESSAGHEDTPEDLFKFRGSGDGS